MASYFQGLEERSNSVTSYFFCGAVVSIAFLPEEVIVEGLDFEKRGLMKDWMRNGDIKSGVRILSEFCERSCCAVCRADTFVQGSRGDENAMAERRI